MEFTQREQKRKILKNRERKVLKQQAEVLKYQPGTAGRGKLCNSVSALCTFD